MRRTVLAAGVAMLAVMSVVVAVPGCERSAQKAVAKAAAKDPGEVEKSFKNLKGAIVVSNGAGAVDCVDDATIKYYGRVRSLMLDADAEALRKEPVTVRILVLSGRLFLKAKDLEGLDDKGTIALFVNRGWLYAVDIRSADLIEFEFPVPGQATATVLSMPNYGPFTGRFVDEGGIWKVSLLPIVEKSEEKAQRRIKELSITEEELVGKAMEMVSDFAPKPTVDPWKPLRAK